MLAPLTDDDVSNEAFGYFRASGSTIGHVPVTALRLSLCRRARLGAVHDRGHRAEAVGHALGRRPRRTGSSPPDAARSAACGSRRAIARGARDMTTGARPVRGRPRVRGPAWTRATSSAGPRSPAGASGRRRGGSSASRSTTPATVLMGKEPVVVDGRAAGYVTSAAFGYTVGRSIAYAWLPAEARGSRDERSRCGPSAGTARRDRRRRPAVRSAHGAIARLSSHGFLRRIERTYAQRSRRVNKPLTIS